MIVHVLARVQDSWYDTALCGERVAWADQLGVEAQVGTVYRSDAERIPSLVTCTRCAAALALEALHAAGER